MPQASTQRRMNPTVGLLCHLSAWVMEGWLTPSLDASSFWVRPEPSRQSRRR
jgi:hypothetical protein